MRFPWCGSGCSYQQRRYRPRLWTLCQDSFDSSCRCATAITLKPCLVYLSRVSTKLAGTAEKEPGPESPPRPLRDDEEGLKMSDAVPDLCAACRDSSPPPAPPLNRRPCVCPPSASPQRSSSAAWRRRETDARSRSPGTEEREADKLGINSRE